MKTAARATCRAADVFASGDGQGVVVVPVPVVPPVAPMPVVSPAVPAAPIPVVSPMKGFSVSLLLCVLPLPDLVSAETARAEESSSAPPREKK
jgi:hypothetical protein